MTTIASLSEQRTSLCAFHIQHLVTRMADSGTEPLLRALLTVACTLIAADNGLDESQQREFARDAMPALGADLQTKMIHFLNG